MEKQSLETRKEQEREREWEQTKKKIDGWMDLVKVDWMEDEQGVRVNKYWKATLLTQSVTEVKG